MSAKYHFFASNFVEFHVDSNLRRLIKFMDKRGFDYAIWQVPLPIEAEYLVDNFRPMTEAMYLGMFHCKDA
jgi:hypothetical protein